MSTAWRRRSRPASPAQDSLRCSRAHGRTGCAGNAVPGDRQVDARVPVRVLNFAWHRLEWPPIESFAGPVDVAHSLHPLMMPSRGAARVVTVHDLYFLDWPERDRGGNPPGLRGARGRSRAARRCRHRELRAHEGAGRRTPRAWTQRTVTVCLPAAPGLAAAGRACPCPAPSCSSGRVEPRKNVPGLLRAYAELADAARTRRELVLAGRLPPRESADCFEREPSIAGRVRAVVTSATTNVSGSTARRRCW